MRIADFGVRNEKNEKLKFEILFGYLDIGVWDLFGIWPACAKPLRRRQVLGVWNLKSSKMIQE
jgi:hypothetical protein